MWYTGSMVSHLALAFCYLCVQPCHTDKLLLKKKKKKARPQSVTNHSQTNFVALESTVDTPPEKMSYRQYTGLVALPLVLIR